MGLFGSSGIRGIANIEISPDLALKVGKAAGKNRSNAAVAADPRISGTMVEKAVTSGLLSAGCNVTRLGIVPTPTLACAAKNFDLGVMITASHNPADYNGIKLWNPDGMAFDTDQQTEIERSIESAKYAPADWDRIGRIDVYENAVKDHIKAIQNVADPLCCSPKVVIDCGNGAGSVITPQMLRMMGCQVLALNAQPDGRFPARNPEPKQENLDLLIKTCQDWGADIGIAHDGDADRLMAVDNRGRFVGGDQLLAIFAAHEDTDRIVVPVDTSMVVDDTLPDVEIIRSRVGDVYVAECMKKNKAAFGGEPSGSWIFPRISFCPDGIYAAVRLIEIIGGGIFSEMIDALPQYDTRRIGFACDNRYKAVVMEDIAAQFSSMGEVSTIDGIRLATDDGWILIRPSGTEPKIRITAEARSHVNELFRTACRIVKASIGSACG